MRHAAGCAVHRLASPCIHALHPRHTPASLPVFRRYAPLVEAIQANMAGGGKDVYVTVLEACGQRKVLPQFLLK